jgi:hypothetical protein
MKKSLLVILALVAFSLCLIAGSAHAGELEILGDYHLTPKWVKAGAYFKDGGNRVKVSHVKIEVMLPVSKNGNAFNYKTRVHDEDNVGEPDWSGNWDEPWAMGFFYYTVKATYQGKQFTKTFIVGRNKTFEALETGVEIAKKINAVRSAGGL